MKTTQRKSSQARFLALALLIALLYASNVFAVSYTAAASGDWSANSTWTPNTGHPVAGDAATINAAFTVTVSGTEACTTLNVQTSGSAMLTVANGGALTVSGTTILNSSATINVNSGGTLTLATATLTLGAVNNNGTMTCGSTLSGVPTITMGAGSVLYIGGTSTLTGTINNTAGTVVYNGGAAQTVKALTYYNLNIGTAIATPAILAAATTVAGNLEILNGGGLNVAASRTLNVTGATTIDSGAILNFSASTAAGTLATNVSVSGTLNFSTTSGIITINGTTTVNNGGTISFGGITAGVTFAGDVTLASGSTWSETVAAKPIFGGNFYNNGASTFAISTGIHTFKGATPNIGGTSVVALNNVAFGDGVNGCNPSSSGSGYTISGTLTIAAGNTTYDSTGTLSVGNLIVNGTCANDGSLTVATLTTIAATGTLNNNSSHTFTGNTGTFTGGAINNNGTMTFSGNITGTGTTVTQGTNASLTFGGTLAAFTLSAGAPNNTVNYTGAAQTVRPASYYNLILSGSGAKTLGGATAIANNLTIGSGTTLDVSSVNNYALSVGGNWVNNGTFNARSGTVTFNGSANQTFTGNAVTFDNVIVNNTGSTSNNTVTVYSGGTVSGTTTITTGHLVVVGPVAQLIWSTPPPATVSPNTLITPFPVIQSADANGNPSTVGLAAHQIITVSLGGSGVLSGTTNFDIGTASTNGSTGTVICSNLSVSGAGSIALIASPDTGLNPATIPGIYVWLDGSDSNSMTFSGSTITAWNDKSGNGNNFGTTFSSPSSSGSITLTADTASLNSRTGVFFPGDGTGNGSSLGCSTLNINNDTLSIYVMVKQTAALPSFYRLCAFANVSSADFDAAGLYLYFNPNLLVARGNIQLGSGAAKPAIGTPWLGEAIFNGSTCTTALLQKGAATGTSSASSSGGFSLTEATVGGALNAGYTDGGGYWSGPIYEYIVYTNTLSAPDQAAVETYLINKWIPSITNATANFSVTGSNPLSINLSGGNVIISWPGSGTLQSSGEVTNGTIWTTVPGASTNSPYSAPISENQMFFRLAP